MKQGPKYQCIKTKYIQLLKAAEFIHHASELINLNKTKNNNNKNN